VFPTLAALTRRRVVLAASTSGLAAALAVTLAACGGGSSSGDSSMPGMTSHSAAAPTAPGARSSDPMAGMATYPPVTPGPAAAGTHNETDLVFASGMIPHHGQAVQMADMVLAKTGNPAVKALAERIKAAQSPEIATMSGWLKGWGQTVPNPYAAMAGMAGMEHGGMMSDEQMNQLHMAAGSAADRTFLTLMQEHHQGAIAMSKTEVAKGSNPQAKTLAQAISTSQTAEIAEMKTTLAGLG
jgi:uncharacterized protein (DUF305 family)